MGHYIELHVRRDARTMRWDHGSDAPGVALTFTKGARIGELMLFDLTSLQVVTEAEPMFDGKPTRDLISDRKAALARFRRRLPQVRAALAWNRSAWRELEAYAQFFAAIDWPYLRLDTGDYRLQLTEEEEQSFEPELEFALSALDLPAIASPGRLFGGPGRYSPAWERLLNFCVRPTGYDPAYRPVDAIYNADERALVSLVCGTPYYLPNDEARLLGAYLPRRAALTIPQIERGKALLGLTPEQDVHWGSLENILRAIALDCVDRVKPAEPTQPLDAESLVAVQDHIAAQANPLAATLSGRQKRVAQRLFRAMGFPAAAAKF